MPKGDAGRGGDPDEEPAPAPDPGAIDIVGIFPDYASAYVAWKAKAQATVDNAHMRYFIAHLHRLREEELAAGPAEGSA